MRIQDVDDNSAATMARQSLQPDGSFGASPVTSRFSNMLSDPRSLFYSVSLSALSLVAARTQFGYVPPALLLAAAIIILTTVASRRARTLRDRADAHADRSYRQFKLFPEHVTLLPGGPAILYVKLTSLSHYVRKHSSPTGGTGYVHEVFLRTTDKAYAFTWSGPSLPPNPTFDDNFNLLLSYLGFRPETSGRAKAESFRFDPRYAPPPDTRLTPLPPDMMYRNVPPAVLVAAAAGIVMVGYWVWSIVR